MVTEKPGMRNWHATTKFRVELRGYHAPIRPFPYGKPVWKRILINIWQDYFLQAKDNYKEALDPPYFIVYDVEAGDWVRWAFDPYGHTDEHKGDIKKFRTANEVEDFVYNVEIHS